MATNVHDRAAVRSVAERVAVGCAAPGGARCERGTAVRRAIELNHDRISRRENHVRGADISDVGSLHRCIGGEIPHRGKMQRFAAVSPFRRRQRGRAVRERGADRQQGRTTTQLRSDTNKKGRRRAAAAEAGQPPCKLRVAADDAIREKEIQHEQSAH